jgi:hypothetical protein
MAAIQSAVGFLKLEFRHLASKFPQVGRHPKSGLFFATDHLLYSVAFYIWPNAFEV